MNEDDYDPKLLLKEIKALGGDRTDLDLVLTEKGDPINDKHLEADLRKFIGSLNFFELPDLADDLIDRKEDIADRNTNLETHIEKKPSNAFKEDHKKLNNEIIENAISKIESSLVSEPSLNLIDPRYKEMIIQPNPIWYTSPSKVHPVKHSSEFFNKAKSLYEYQSALYATQYSSSNSNKDFVSTVLKSGTTADKVSCLVLLVQESPLLRWNHFKSLIQMMSKPRNVGLVIDSICDLLVSNILPDWKLLYFEQQAIDEETSDEVLVRYYFEDMLKKEYASFISLLDVLKKLTFRI